MIKLEKDIRSAYSLIDETGTQIGEWLVLKVMPALRKKDKKAIKKIKERFSKLEPALPGLQEFLNFLKKD